MWRRFRFVIFIVRPRLVGEHSLPNLVFILYRNYVGFDLIMRDFLDLLVVARVCLENQFRLLLFLVIVFDSAFVVVRVSFEKILNGMCGRVILSFTVRSFEEFLARFLRAKMKSKLEQKKIKFVGCNLRLSSFFTVGRLPFRANFEETQRCFVFVLVVNRQLSYRFQFLTILH